MNKVNIERFLLGLLILISRIINWGFKSVLNRFISLFTIGSSLCLLFSQNIGADLIGIFFISLILSLSVVRVSDNFILSLFTGHLSMSLLNPYDYRRYSYFNSKKEISEILKENFIVGIVNASRYRKTLRFSTHGWFLKNIVLTDEVTTLFEINEKDIGKTRIIFEVLSLLSLKEAFGNVENTFQVSIKKRRGYSIVLNKKI